MPATCQKGRELRHDGLVAFQGAHQTSCVSLLEGATDALCDVTRLPVQETVLRDLAVYLLAMPTAADVTIDESRAAAFV